MSYFRIQWPRYLMVLCTSVMLLAVVPASRALAGEPHPGVDHARLDGPARSRSITGQIQRHLAGDRGGLGRGNRVLSVEDTIPQLGIVVVDVPQADTRAQLAAAAAALEARPGRRVGGAELHLHARR